MPMFYLHQSRGPLRILDVEGAEFASLEQAHAEAVTAGREIIAAAVLTGVVDLSWFFEIVREDGARDVVRLADVVEFRRAL
jgi:hypothetical protein